MTISDARSFVGQEVALTWTDRKGEELRAVTKIYAADFIPMYGPCLVTDAGEIRIDRVVNCDLLAARKAA